MCQVKSDEGVNGECGAGGTQVNEKGSRWRPRKKIHLRLENELDVEVRGFQQTLLPEPLISYMSWNARNARS